jgi:hypothetical protein
LAIPQVGELLNFCLESLDVVEHPIRLRRVRERLYAVWRESVRGSMRCGGG